jgi:hypothetical protein
MLREDGGGPDGSNSVGDLRGRRGCSRLCTRCRLDCFIWDVPGSGSELLGASAWLDVDHGDGTIARWLWWRSGTCNTKRNRGEKRGNGSGVREGTRVFDGIEEGLKGERGRKWSFWRGEPHEHADLVLARRRQKGVYIGGEWLQTSFCLPSSFRFSSFLLFSCNIL